MCPIVPTDVSHHQFCRSLTLAALDQYLTDREINQICLYRAGPQGHMYLRKNHLRVTSFRGQRKENVREGLHDTVKTYFGIAPRWVEEAKAVLAERRAKRSGGECWEGLA